MTQVFIYGGCVSRDTFRFLDDSFVLQRYVARQSAISAMSPASPSLLKRLSPSSSSFQQRMVEWDVRSSLVTHLRRDAPSTDLLLVDLNVERLGALRTENGYVTRSNELWTGANGARALRGAPSVTFGSEAHFELWSHAWTRLVASLVDLGLLEKTLLLETPWATHLNDGTALTTSPGTIEPTKANETYVRYYRHLSGLGVRCATLPEALAVSHAAHQWGAGPYHYIDDAYDWLADAIRGFATEPS